MLLSQRFQNGLRGRIVAESFTDVSHAIYVSGIENEAATKLEGIFSQLALTMSASLGAFARQEVLLAKEMEQAGFFQAQQAICLALLVNKQREGDLSFPAKSARVLNIAQADGCKPGALLLEFWLVVAQLRNVLAAENSPVMTQKYYNRRVLRPQRAKLHWFAVNVGQRNARQLAAEGIVHLHILTHESCCGSLLLLRVGSETACRKSNGM